MLDDPTAARSLIPLPDDEAGLHELAEDIATFALPANKEYSRMWQRRYVGAVAEPIWVPRRDAPLRPEQKRGGDAESALRVLPRFEVVFRIAAEYAGYHNVQDRNDYDVLLVLAAWLSLKREQHPHGFLSVYPKALLCPLAHNSSPAELNSLSSAERQRFALRAPVYLRYLLLHMAGVKNCLELENGAHRSVLKSHGFKLVSADEIPEFIFPGITRGADPAVRPWLLGRSGMFDGTRGRERLVQAGLWVARFKEQVLNFEKSVPIWDFERMRDIDWDASFKAEGVGGAKSWSRLPEIRNWRGLLRAVVERVGCGTHLPSVVEEFFGKRNAISLDSDSQLWTKLDACTCRVMDRLRDTHSDLFDPGRSRALKPGEAKRFRHWTGLYDLESTNILTEYGVSAFHALQHVFPQWFGWSPDKLKPWEVEQENARWRGRRGWLLFKSAYAFSLLEAGLGRFESTEEGCHWICTKHEFETWYRDTVLLPKRAPSEVLYQIASRGKLTPLLNGELTPGEAVSFLASRAVHRETPAWDKHRWARCMNLAFNDCAGSLRVRLDLASLPPFPLDVREILLAPVGLRYAHPHIAFVRSIDIQLMHDAHFARLEDIPGWFDDLRLIGTPLEHRLNEETSELRSITERIADSVCNIKLDGRPRFSVLSTLAAHDLNATSAETPTSLPLTDEEFRFLCRISRDEVLNWTNIVPATQEKVARALTRLVNREQVRELVQCAIVYVDSHRALSSESDLSRFNCLDIIDDLLALTIKSCAQHLIDERGTEEPERN